MESTRVTRLRQWMFGQDITYRAVAERMGVSLSTVGKLLKAAEIPLARHSQFLQLGFPVDLLPIPMDKKTGPKVKVPKFLGAID